MDASDLAALISKDWSETVIQAAEALENAKSGASLKDASWWEDLFTALTHTQHAADELSLSVLSGLNQGIADTLKPVKDGMVDLSSQSLKQIARALRKWKTLRDELKACGIDGELESILRSLGIEGLIKSASASPAQKPIMADIAKYLPLFVEETEEGVEAMQRSLLEMEAGAKKNGFVPPSNQVDELFRHAHKLKASAGAMGFHALSETTHSMETVLDRMRNGKLRLTPEIASTLLVAVDNIRTEIETAKAGNVPSADLLSIRAALMWFLDAAPVPAPTNQNETLIPIGGGPESDDATRAATPLVPLSGIRVSVGTLDELMNLSGELSITKNSFTAVSKQIHTMISQKTGMALDEAIQQLSQLVSGIQNLVLEMRMVPISPVFERCRRVVRDLSTELQKDIEITIQGADTTLDRKIVDHLSDPLNHMVRNAIDHGIETPAERMALGKPAQGKIAIHAEREGGRIVITLSDDGRGINFEDVRKKSMQLGLLTRENAGLLSEKELLPFIFHPGLSTARNVTNISGRGVGMDIVRKRIEEIKGTIDISSNLGAGCTFRISLPLTVVSQNCLLFSIQAVTFAFPIHNVAEILRCQHDELVEMGFGKFLRIREDLIPVFRIKHFFKDERFTDSSVDTVQSNLVIARAGDRKVGLLVDDIMGEEEILVKHPGTLVGDIPGIQGVSVLTSGTIALILDVEKLVERYGKNDFHG